MRFMNFIDGVTLLNEITTSVVTHPNLLLLFGGGAAILCVVFWSIIFEITNGDMDPVTPVWTTIVIMFIAMWICPCTTEQVTQYEVIITEEVNMEEFYQNYEVIKQR